MKNFEKYENEIKELNGKYAVNKQTKKPLSCGDIDCDNCLFQKDCENCDFFNIGNWILWLYEEYKESILTIEEKKYLENVIRPFLKKGPTIMKIEDDNNQCHINIDLGDDNARLPMFHKKNIFKNMKPFKEYTIVELGLFEGED